MAKFTSERIIPDYYLSSTTELALYLMHLKAYTYISAKAKGKKVLDLGCGLGYGSAILAEKAESVVGADIDSEAVKSASSSHKRENLSFKAIDEKDINLSVFEKNSFDIVVSFQVIEHVKDDCLYLSSIKRVLKNRGEVYITTPNRTARVLDIQHPWNHHHLREYSSKELESLFVKYFYQVECMGLTAQRDVLINELERVRRIAILMIPFSNKLFTDKLRRIVLSHIWDLSVGKKKLHKKEFSEQTIDLINSDIFLTKLRGRGWLNLFVKAVNQI
jgi:2-polyprenyl-3-methyl-5-hydroxy-6-metoxy-1,4-benzoquinol methylase